MDISDCVAVYIVTNLGSKYADIYAMVNKDFAKHVKDARKCGLLRRIYTMSSNDTMVVACIDGCIGVCTIVGYKQNKNMEIPRGKLESSRGDFIAGASISDYCMVVWTRAGQAYVQVTGDPQSWHQFVIDKHIVGAVAGDKYFMVWTSDGEVWASGQGASGQLGLGEMYDCVDPTYCDALAGDMVIGVSIGLRHTVVWTSTGNVYTFGCGDNGRLGHGDGEMELVPRVVTGLVDKVVVGAAAGMIHTVVWTNEGEVYTFGCGEHGRLGHGGLGHGGLGHGEEINDEWVPRCVEALRGKRVVGAAAGECHTVIWTEEGKMYTFGFGGSGCLGHPPKRNCDIFDNEDFPREVDSMNREKIIGGIAGRKHTVVWTEGGSVLGFGAYSRDRGHVATRQQFDFEFAYSPAPK